MLPVDGAGLSLLAQDYRVPLGASDESATLAERLQFTQGEGPCLDASGSDEVVVATNPELELRWPAFATELFAHTPYRAVVAVPLRLYDGSRGAFDLYLTDPQRRHELVPTDLAAVAKEIEAALAIGAAAARFAGSTAPLRIPGPPWLQGPAATDRTAVWIAMGLVMADSELAATDALAVIRSWAYIHDTVLETVAADLLARRLHPSQLTA